MSCLKNKIFTNELIGIFVFDKSFCPCRAYTDKMLCRAYTDKLFCRAYTDKLLCCASKHTLGTKV